MIAVDKVRRGLGQLPGIDEMPGDLVAIEIQVDPARRCRPLSQPRSPQ